MQSGGNNHIKKQSISLDSVARRFINLHIEGKQIGLTVTGLKQWKQCQTLFFWAQKSLQMVTAAIKLKDAYSLEGKL